MASKKVTAVILGEWNLDTYIDCDNVNLIECYGPVYEVPVANQIVNENYSNKDNDIALLELGERIQFNTFMQPACMPLVEIDFDGMSLIVAGESRACKMWIGFNAKFYFSRLG